MKLGRWILLGLLLTPGMATAQERCHPGETPVDCLNRQLPSPPPSLLTASGIAADTPSLEQAVVRSADYELSLRNTGPQSSEGGRQSSMKDFDSPFLAWLEAAAGGTRKGDTVVFQWNVPFNKDSLRKLNLNLALKDPSMDSVVEKGLSADQLTKQNATLDQLDDATVKIAWSFNHPENPRTNEGLRVIVRNSLLSAVSEELERMALNTYSITTDRSVDLKGFEGSVKFGEFREKEEEAQRAVDEAVWRAKANAEARRAQVRDAVTEILDRYARATAEVLKNKPQFWGEAGYHLRDPLIGASDINASLTYELPLGEPALDDTGGGAVSRLAAERRAFTRALAVAEDPSKAEVKRRLTFKAEYKQIRRRTLDADLGLSADILSKVNKAGSHSVSASAVGSWDFPSSAPDRDGKLDLNATYENDSSNAAKKNRLIGSLTFTQRVSQTLSIPIALVYSNHPNLLTDVDKRFSAHVGISYKIGAGEAPKKAAARLLRQ
jgi:hypothetical protein